MNRFAVLATAGVLGLCSTIVSADELNFSMGADLAFKQLGFSTFEPTGMGTTKVENKSDLWTLAIAPTVSYGRFFVSLSAERSIGSSSDPIRNSSGDFSGVASTARRENALLAGATLWGGLSVFGGVMNNETEYLKSSSASTYRDKGPFAGFAYSHSFTSGTLSGTLAYATAKTEFNQEITAGDINSGTGDLKGSSFSLMWVTPLGGSWSGRMGYRGTRYKSEVNVASIRSSITPAVFNPPNIEVNQKYDAFVMGVVKAF